MKRWLTVFGLGIISFFALFFALSFLTKSTSATGILNGRLSQCPQKPNCVCSEYQDDTAHAIAPIQIPAEITEKPLPLMKKVIQELGGEIQSETDIYLAATFTSKFFRFVDDVEIRVDSAENLIHIRSASRAGYGDMGANKARVTLIRALFAEKTAPQ